MQTLQIVIAIKELKKYKSPFIDLIPLEMNQEWDKLLCSEIHNFLHP
jgi:hypothetical protein